MSAHRRGAPTPGQPGDGTAAPVEAREISGATTGLVLAYVTAQAGEAGVEEVVRRAGIPFTAAELSRPSTWVSHDSQIRLMAAATEVLGDPRAMFEVGAESLGSGMTAGVVLLVRALGSPRQVLTRLLVDFTQRPPAAV